MAAYHFTFPPGRPSFAEAVTSMPEEVRASFKQAFRALARLSDGQIDTLAKRSVEAFEEGEPTREERIDLASGVGINQDDVAPLVGTLMFMLAVAAWEKETPEGAIDELVKANILEATEKPRVLAILQKLKGRAGDVQRTFGRGQLADQVLPSFRGLTGTVDVRLSFGQRVFAVPVCIMHLTTDVEQPPINFQITAARMRRLIRRLEELLRHLEQAETWSETWGRQK